MMHGHEKSDLAIVAEKPANKAEQPTAEASTGASAAEPVERRAGTKGNAGQQSTCRAQKIGRASCREVEESRFVAVELRRKAVAGREKLSFFVGERCEQRLHHLDR